MLRRWRAAWPRRPRRFDPPWPQITPAAPTWSPAFLRQALRRLLPIRRGAYHEPVWPASTVPPTFRDQTARRAALARRGRFLAVPPAPAAPAAPGAVPARWRARSRLLPSRRGRFYGPTWEPVVYGTGLALGVGNAGRPGRFAALGRRGAYHEPPWTVAAAQPSVWRPQPVRATLRLAGRPIRRGSFYEPPWPQVAAQPSVWRPDPVQQAPRLAGRPVRHGGRFDPPWPQVAAAPSVWQLGHIRAVPRLAGRPTRRSAYHEPPWPQVAPSTPPWPPELISTRARWATLTRPGEYLWTPPRPAGVPAWLRSRPRPTPSLRRRRFHEPRWVEGPQSVWRPPFKGQAGPRPRFAAELRRGRYFEPGWPQAQQFIGELPRWVEEAGGSGGLVEGGGAGGGMVERAGAGIGLVEGGGSI